MTLPSFIILGVQRGGTTSLYDYLTNHPRIARAKRKEVHFFDLEYARGVGWYRAQFPRFMWLRPKRITGEASPYYLFHPAVRDRVADTVPDARFIVLLRNPVERAYSHYHLARRREWEPLSFGEAVAAEPARLAGEAEKLDDPTYKSFAHQNLSYVVRGHYAEQLEWWWQRFDRDRFLLLRSEDLFADPRATLNDTLAFLGLDPVGLDEYAHRNLGGYGDDMDPDVRTQLEDHYRPHNRRLYELLGRDLGWPA